MTTVEEGGPPQRLRSNGFGMLLMRPVVFSGWFVRLLDNAYEAENENVRAIRRSTRSCML